MRTTIRHSYRTYGASLAVTIITTAILTFSFHALAKSFKNAADFAQKATIGGEFEVKSSQLALNRSKNADVRTFAQQMVDDHSKAGDALKATLPQSTVAPSTIKEDTLDDKHQKMLDKLRNASDKEFDTDYVRAQRKAHDEAVGLFKDYAKAGDDPSLKAFAAQTLPTLQQHQKMVQNLKL